MSNNNHKANQNNGNKGTSGNNPAYQKAQDNRGNQLNPNNPNYQGKKITEVHWVRLYSRTFFIQSNFRITGNLVKGGGINTKTIQRPIT
ncbi:hypothetical protein [Pseudoalteromonas sp. S1727]|uniref:hypothetical protein n=1 Tax=Pseudoalteromonas sp. S1727 TaxID=2066514 RepID=UPI001BB25F50|nr:hypothetical protein [Pseudoalteromonas sp. S1727]